MNIFVLFYMLMYSKCVYIHFIMFIYKRVHVFFFISFLSEMSADANILKDASLSICTTRGYIHFLF